MKKRVLMKKLIRIFAICFFLITICNICLADGGEIPTSKDIIKQHQDEAEIISIGNVIIGIIQYVGSAVSVIVIVILGIKYMTSSIEEKAEYKQSFIYYIIGAILTFGAVNILSIIYNSIN